SHVLHSPRSLFLQEIPCSDESGVAQCTSDHRVGSLLRRRHCRPKPLELLFPVLYECLHYRTKCRKARVEHQSFSRMDCLGMSVCRIWIFAYSLSTSRTSIGTCSGDSWFCDRRNRFSKLPNVASESRTERLPGGISLRCQLRIEPHIIPESRTTVAE